jgi:hypothetical protein
VCRSIDDEEEGIGRKWGIIFEAEVGVGDAREQD